jgi:outer membrane biosynthesis protein TonB
MKNVSNTLTTVGALAAAVLAGSSAGGTAVLEPPADVQDLAGTAPVAQTKPAKKRGKGKGNPPAAPQPPASPATPAPIVDAATEKELELPVGTTAALAATQGKHMRDSKISKEERKAAHVAAVETALAIGLGERAAGYGPIIRSVILRMVKGTFNLKSVQIQSVNSATIRAILSDATFKTKAITALEEHLADVKERAAKLLAKTGRETSATTLETRAENTEKARKWINGGLNESYLQSLVVIEQLGNRVTLNGIAIPIDRLLGVAFGKNITAGELFKHASTAQVSKA